MQKLILPASTLSMIVYPLPPLSWFRHCEISVGYDRLYKHKNHTSCTDHANVFIVGAVVRSHHVRTLQKRELLARATHIVQQCVRAVFASSEIRSTSNCCVGTVKMKHTV